MYHFSLLHFSFFIHCYASKYEILPYYTFVYVYASSIIVIVFKDNNGPDGVNGCVSNEHSSPMETDKRKEPLNTNNEANLGEQHSVDNVGGMTTEKNECSTHGDGTKDKPVMDTIDSVHAEPDRVDVDESSVDKPDESSRHLLHTREQLAHRTLFDTHSSHSVDSTDSDLVSHSGSHIVSQPDTVNNISGNDTIGLITEDVLPADDVSSVNNDNADVKDTEAAEPGNTPADSETNADDVVRSPVDQDENSLGSIPGLLPEVREMVTVVVFCIYG